MYVEHLRIPVGSGAVHVERAGRGGPAIVLLHGFGTCTFLWRRVSPALAALGYTVLAIDLMGHGESDRPADVGYGLAAQAEHVARALAALRVAEASFVGQDIGGLVAVLLAAQNKVTARDILLLSPPDPDDLPGADIRALQRTSARVALGANTLFGALPALAPLLRASVSAADRMPDLLIARYLAPFVGADGLSQLLLRASAIELDPRSRALLAHVRAPIHVAEGDLGPPRPSLSWNALFPQSQVHTTRLQGALALLPEDAPEAVSGLLTEWLARQRKS
jgi:pimeloyl-ACP methyl ester carboxylesterase